MTEETTTDQLAEIDRDMADIERQVAELVEEAQRADYPQPEPQPQPQLENCGFEGKILREVLESWLPCDTGDTTTSEQLAEIEGQAEDTPATEYTPPEGWRVLAVGERLRDGDMWVWPTNDQLRQTVHVGAVVGANQRYIRPIESQPQPEPEPQSEPVQVREGRWRTRNGLVKDVTAMPTDHEDYAAAYPWWDGVSTWRNDGRWLAGGSTMDLVTYLGPIEAEREPQPESDTAAIEELRCEVSYVQNLLGTERRRVTQLEDLVTSLRTIKRGCENAVREAGNMNTALRNQLAAVKAELVTQAETSRRLQIELDAAQQVPQAIADRFKEGWNQGTARAVEAIAEWLEPIRLVDSAYLANATMQHLPQIMRTLTGLDSHAID